MNQILKQILIDKKKSYSWNKYAIKYGFKINVVTNKGNGKNKFHKRKFVDFNYSNYTNNVLRKKEIVSFMERISILKGIVDSIRKKVREA